MYKYYMELIIQRNKISLLTGVESANVRNELRLP